MSPSLSNVAAGSLPVQSWPCCPLPETALAERQHHRLACLAALGLDNNRSVASFEEAAQIAARYLQVPVAWVSVADGTTEYIKGAYGLSQFGLTHPLLLHRQMPLGEGLSHYVLASHQPLVLPDLTLHSTLAQAPLVASQGLITYGAVPLITSDQQCVGTLAIMDVKPHSLTERDMSFLTMTARWAMGDYERSQGGQPRGTAAVTSGVDSQARSPIDSIQLHLISQLTQDLRSPLTAVLGMASMLRREIYGPLTPKQREYTEIVCTSSQTLMTLVGEIIELSGLTAQSIQLAPTSVDIQYLSQLVLATLHPLAEKRAQTLELTIEPHEHQWILDKAMAKQVLYHLVFSVMQLAGENSTIRVHASRKGAYLALAVWLANPWLGEGLPAAIVEFCQALSQAPNPKAPPTIQAPLVANGLSPDVSVDVQGLLLSQYLAQQQHGQFQLHGGPDVGHRIVVLLPNLEASSGRTEGRIEPPAEATLSSDVAVEGLSRTPSPFGLI
ncbi:GAF domain-containing sensor histidine kinase [Nodosilinea sp. P-1105]|nr:GAF domain-containing sensor histidine kinase [Nodosilinea sp. P-1105]